MAGDLATKRGGDAPRGGDCGSECITGNPPTILPPGARLITNPETGNQVVVGASRRSAFSFTRPMVKPKAPISGLEIFETSLSLKFVYTRTEPIDEERAREIQRLAGWSDQEYGHGFYSFETSHLGDGVHEATWCCWKSTE